MKRRRWALAVATSATEAGLGTVLNLATGNEDHLWAWVLVAGLVVVSAGLAVLSQPGDPPRPPSDPAGSPPMLDEYLDAARKAAGHHPYPPLANGERPRLDKVYLGQKIQQRGAGNHHQADTVVSPDELLAHAGICVVVAAAGGGKSSLLRTLVGMAGRDGNTTVVPVMVTAVRLTQHQFLKDAIAEQVNDDLSAHGLASPLPAEFFASPPRPGASWKVLVDGFDEIIDPKRRQRALSMICESGSPWQFVVATRPLPSGALDFLDKEVTYYDLLPFAPKDLATFATRWFKAREVRNPSVCADAFTAALKIAGLSELAKSPLMATMLCQIYATKSKPGRQLPDTRTAIYQRFLDLFHEHHYETTSLRDRLTEALEKSSAGKIIESLFENTPRLLSYLADRLHAGNTGSVVGMVAKAKNVTRPDSVTEPRWNEVLRDLLLGSGLLVERAGKLEFSHWTIVEFLAATYATRDKLARQRCITLFNISSEDKRWKPVNLDPSYCGFIIDRLLQFNDSRDAISRYLEHLATRGSAACRFLTTQVGLRTNLPRDTTAAALAGYAADTTLGDHDRAEAARALAGIPDYEERGARLLKTLADDSSFGGNIHAAWALTSVDGSREEGAKRLVNFARNATLNKLERVEAANALVGVPGYQQCGINLLAKLANDPTLDNLSHVYAAEWVARADGFREQGAQLLTNIATSTTLSVDSRAYAAIALAKIDGYRAQGANLLIAFATDAATASLDRVHVAESLARVGFRKEAVQLLASLATDATFSGLHRVWAAQSIAEIDDSPDRSVDLLTNLATDTNLDGTARVEAAGAVTSVDDFREKGIQLFATLADDATLDNTSRMDATQAVTEYRRFPST